MVQDLPQTSRPVLKIDGDAAAPGKGFQHLRLVGADADPQAKAVGRSEEIMGLIGSGRYEQEDAPRRRPGGFGHALIPKPR